MSAERPMARQAPPAPRPAAKAAKAQQPRKPIAASPRIMCLPCCQGEHRNCRHRNDGPRFGPSDGPCKCEERGHTIGVGTCTDMRMADWSYNRCGKPAKGTITIAETFGKMNDRKPIEVERCGIHLAGHKRAVANEEKRNAEYAAQRADDERRGANSKASHDWAKRLADEFGVRATGTRPSDRLRVLVEPEHLYGLLADWHGMLRDAGIDPTEEQR